MGIIGFRVIIGYTLGLYREMEKKMETTKVYGQIRGFLQPLVPRHAPTSSYQGVGVVHTPF